LDQPASTQAQQGGHHHASTNQNAKAHRVFCEVILPLADDHVYPTLPKRTSFVFTEEDILASTLSRIDKKCPHLYRDRERFMRAVESIVYG
jgi:hypothetical protein